MKDVKEIIRIYTEKLNWIYSKANTKSKKKKIVYDLFSFSEICHEHFNINEDFIWENDNELISLIVNPDMYFIDNILNSKIMFNNISNSVITIFKDSKFPFYKNQGKVLNSLTPEKISEIVFDFISEYDNNLLKLYEDKLYNNEIFIGNLFENTGGLTYQLNTLNKTWIFMNSELDYSILFASTIVHELGHAYEDDILNKTGLSCHGLKTSCSPYYEVPSNFLEYAFLNYLKENKIYNSDADIILSNYYIDLFEYMYAINILLKIYEINITTNDYVEMEIKKEEIINYANELNGQLNYYSYFSDLNNIVNYKNAFIYGIGHLMSLYLYEVYKENPKYFKKEFKNALINYYTEGINAFKGLNITEEKLINNKVLSKVLKENR
ncbi:MAG: hypothetical protein IJZ46_00105 [Bacilli bacterium]|nr:hypothetical protein [Bacilli bacterium]